MTIQARTLIAEFDSYHGIVGGIRDALLPYREEYQTARRASDKRSPRLCLWVANLKYIERDYDTADELLLEAIERYEAKRDWFGRGMAFFYRARLANRARTAEEAREWARQSIADFRHALADRDAFRVGICHVLLAWIAYWDNNTTLADEHLDQASAMLKDSDDLIHLGRIDFIRGCMRRAAAITADEFSEAIELFEAAIDRFADKQGNHQPYLASARNNLALTHARFGTDEAFKTARLQLELARSVSHDDLRTRAETFYISARLLLRQHDRELARSEADEALTLAREAQVGSLEAEILILRGRILLASPQPESHFVEIEEALVNARTRVVGRRRRTEVACWLLQGELEARRHRDDQSIADASLLKARQLMSGLNNRFLESWADRLQGRLAALDGALYLGWHGSLQYRHVKRRLQVWLVWAALQRSSKRGRGKATRVDVADQLGVTRQVLETWLDSWRRTRPTEEDERERVEEILQALQPRGMPRQV